MWPGARQRVSVTFPDSESALCERGMHEIGVMESMQTPANDDGCGEKTIKAAQK